ncbi:MAG TPA: TPM domain-containing protein [Phycisphaerales bacterium]|nr:TPM domain-containing protein [Phycisphaerales bacterium]
MTRTFFVAALATALAVPPAAAQPAEPALPASPPAAQPARTAQPPLIELKPDYPAPPTDGIFVSDRGAVFTVDEQTRLNKAAAKIRFASGLPVMVVTVRSLEAMGMGPEQSVDTYAREVFRQWGIPTAKDDRGLMIFISRDDKQARVLLGAGWAAEHEPTARRIAEATLTPALNTTKVGEAVLLSMREVESMLGRAGYSTELPDTVAPPVDGKILPPSPQSAVPPPSSSFIATIGRGTWLAIIGGVVVLIIFAVLAAKGRRG